MRSYDFASALSAMARERLETSAIGEMIKLVTQHDALSFAAGEPSTELLPIDLFKKSFTGVFDDPAQLGYYWSDLGHIALRDWIVKWMKRDGLVPDWVSSDNIMMTCGSQEGISLAAEALIDPGSYVLVENPTYMETLLTFRKQGAVCIGVPIDEQGIIPEELEGILRKKTVRFLYSIPNFQNPSGYTATIERRRQILEILRKYNIPLVEDDPYHYLSYDGSPPPSYIKLADDDKRVVYLGSFSKILAPGIRCGWMIVPDSLMQKVISLRVNACLSLPILVQQGLFNMVIGLDMKKYTSNLSSLYRIRRDGILKALDTHLRDLGLLYNKPKGGFFIWGKLKVIDDMMDFARYSIVHEKVGFIPGSVFYVAGVEDTSSIRFSFAKVDEAEANEGAKRLAKAIRSYRR